MRNNGAADVAGLKDKILDIIGGHWRTETTVEQGPAFLKVDIPIRAVRGIQAIESVMAGSSVEFKLDSHPIRCRKNDVLLHLQGRDPQALVKFVTLAMDPATAVKLR